MDPTTEAVLQDWAEESAQRALVDPPPKLRIIIWGPALEPESRNEHRRLLQGKRKRIVDDLVKLGHAATTSEDLIARVQDHPVLSGVAEQPLHHLESIQLEGADFVVVLFGSAGTTGEVAGLLRSRRIARRTAVFVAPDLVDGSYMDAGPLANIRALGGVFEYDSDDLRCCAVAQVARELAADLAESLRGSTI